MIDIHICRDRHDLKAFERLPLLIYEGDWRYGKPHPRPLNQLYDPRVNPLLHNGPHRFLLAIENERLIMRALTGTDEVFIRRTGSRQGYISLFDGYDRPDAMAALVEHIVDFQRAEGNRSVVGPNPPDNSGFGLGALVSGYDQPPSLFCPYNAPYYESLFLDAGFQCEKEHYGYLYRDGEINSSRYERVDEWARKRFDLRVEMCDLNAGARAYRAIHAVTEGAEHGMSIEDTVSVFKPIRPYVRRDFLFIAYQRCEPAGLLLALPDGGLRRLGKIGKRAPASERENRLRVVTLYVAKRFRGGGVTAALFAQLMRAAKAHGVSCVQAATIDAENRASIAGAERAGGVRNRVFRQYRLDF